MNLYIKNHTFWFELENVTQLFFPNEKINVFRVYDSTEEPYILSEMTDKLTVKVKIGNFSKCKSADISSENGNNEMTVCQMLYKLLCEFSGMEQPWGMLTGVRPVKLLRKLSQKYGKDSAKDKLLKDYFVSKDKLELAEQTEINEKKIIDLSRPESFSLYVGIPFCPSRCSYCSFVMSSVERANELIEPYVGLLCEELKATAEIANSLGLRLETVYFGGGTPTTLSAEQLDRLLKTVSSYFDMSNCREFTVEGGRPDTIDRDKLYSLIENKVNRISINPQTLNDNILRKIGRKHTSRQFFDAFALARECGFKNINTDLIAGLPTDTFESFIKSIEAVIALNAECITVHTLCMKRASTLTTNGAVLNCDDAFTARKMLEYAKKQLLNTGYISYYLYRQSRMVGNLENVGWSKKGFESYYNVYVMDETHTILACGSGGVTKLRKAGAETDYLERIFNFKYPYEYLNRFDELIKKKKAISKFYCK